MSGARKLYPAGSTGPLRADVLCALGVMKVVTADQVQRLALPHLSFRHSRVPESERKAARKVAPQRGQRAGHPPPGGGGRVRRRR